MFSKTADWIGEKKIVEFKVRGYCQWYNTLDLYFYLQHHPAGELESTSAEYQLLEQMNRWARCTGWSFWLVPPKNDYCARPIENSDTWNFFDVIYNVMWYLVIFWTDQSKKHPVDWRYDTWPRLFRVTCTKYTDMRQVTQNVSKGVSAQYYHWNEMILTTLFKGVRPE